MSKRSLPLAAFAAALTLLTPSTVQAAPAASQNTEGTAYVIQFVDGVGIGEQVRSARAQGITIGRTYQHAFPGFVADLTPEQAAAFAHRPDVVSVEVDAPVYVTGTQANPVWGLDRIDQRALPLSASYTYTDSATAVAYVIDTGVRADHAEFGGRVSAGYNAFADLNGSNDCHGHGTHVAGTIAGATFGVTKASTIIPVRVLDCTGGGTVSSVVAGLDWAVANHQVGVPAVANMSLGGGISSSIDAATQRLIDDGVTVVVAAGNSSTSACNSSPARVAAAITVAASDSSDRQASFSNYGSCVDLYAPGVGITSAGITSTTATATMSGTSMAAPHVAGAVAALLGAQPALTPAQTANTLIANTTPGVITNPSTGTPNRLLYTGTATSTPVTAVAPDAPTNVTATAAKRAATVTWTAPANGGSAITGYTVKAYIGSTLAGSVTVTGTKVTITGLRTGQTYTFAVVATNAVGSSPESSRSNPVTVK